FWAYQGYSHSLSGWWFKIGLAFSCLVDQKRNGKKGGFLLFDRAIHTPKKRDCCNPAKLQGQKRCKSA
ncbi:MAG: hypothetical protein WCJ47_07150, partial [Methanomicrobiales archaeon]